RNELGKACVQLSFGWNSRNEAEEVPGVEGCVFAMLIVYLHETHFGEYSEDDEARPPWISYWRGDRLKERLKLEKKDSTVSKFGISFLQNSFLQRPQNEEANAAVRNERRTKMRHEVNDEAVQPPPSADLDAAAIEPPHNSELHAAAENERRSKHRHEVNVEEI
ncbi:hypothetical protein PIB30_110687, partial [Stylosanthes scabra]|nr:hypothetical protein [Stylosanthes scabra]